MSTNPFRQIRQQQDPGTSNSTFGLDSKRIASDGSGPRALELSLDTKVPPSSLDRHVSFASPPVERTIPAASYPSSPESTRFSPPAQYTAPVSSFSTDYRTATQNDPFEDPSRDRSEDRSIQVALSDAQSNTTVNTNVRLSTHTDDVRDTLSGFAAAPRPAPPPAANPASQSPLQGLRQSLDVDSFKRLLLTGDTGQSTSESATPPILRHNTRVLSDNSSGTDTTSVSQQSLFDTDTAEAADTPRSSHEQEREAQVPSRQGSETNVPSKAPPPAPAPRRAKSVKPRPTPVPPSAEPTQSAALVDTGVKNQGTSSRKPPIPPLARRLSQKASSNQSDEASLPPLETNADSPTDSHQAPTSKAPPLPPVRRQQSISHSSRRASHDLASTIEEAEPQLDTLPSSSSRRPSNDRPQPYPSRNVSNASRRQSSNLMAPPPLPPPRKGRGSSRSSMDSYRPSSVALMGDESTGEVAANIEVFTTAKERDTQNLTPSNANSILAELANLQKELEAARRGA